MENANKTIENIEEIADKIGDLIEKFLNNLLIVLDDNSEQRHLLELCKEDLRFEIERYCGYFPLYGTVYSIPEQIEIAQANVRRNFKIRQAIDGRNRTFPTMQQYFKPLLIYIEDQINDFYMNEIYLGFEDELKARR